jgi:nucleotide-binding universal stress UspA family protein
MYYQALMRTPSTHSNVPAPLRNRTAPEPFAKVQPKQRWLVPVDGTPVAMSAIEYVIAHADSARAHVHVVNVQPPLMAGDVSVLASAKLVADLRRSAGGQALAPAKTLLNRHSFEHSCEVAYGAPAEAIVRSAAERGCAKIVMGARATGLLGTIVGRSVSSRVVRLSHVPVTLVRPESVAAGLAASRDAEPPNEHTPLALSRGSDA